MNDNTMQQVPERKGIKIHIFKMSQEKEINECLRTIRLAEHGVHMNPGSMFKEGNICIFENLEPLEATENKVALGHTNEEMLRPIDQKWRKFQSALQETDITLEYYRPRCKTGSQNTQNENQRIVKEHEKLREDILSRMAMCRREALLIVSGRYPQLELDKTESESYKSAFELPPLEQVEPESVYGKPPAENKKGFRPGFRPGS